MTGLHDVESYSTRLQDKKRAEYYARRFDSGSRRRIDQREQNAVRKVFATLPECRSVLDVPRGFAPLQAISVLSLTMVGVVGAVLVFAAMCRLSARPVRLFTIVASVALFISWAGPLGVYFANAFPGTTASRIVGVMSLHAIAGVVTIALLRTYGTAVR